MELDDRPLGPDATLLRCRGRLNMTAAPEFRRYLEAIFEEGAARVVVDLTGTSFIDSSGLGALIGGLKQARSRGGDLRIAAPSEQVRMVLGLTNLDRVLKPYDDVDEAGREW